MLARIVVSLCLVSTAVMAADSNTYRNSRFGYSIDLPTEFKTVSVADNGDGMSLQSVEGTAKLLVWGNYIMDGSFRDESNSRRKFYIEDGWQISYQKQTASWASFSGAKENRILYVREIALCDGAVGNFSLEYPSSDQQRYGAVVDKLVKSMAAAKPCK